MRICKRWVGQEIEKVFVNHKNSKGDEGVTQRHFATKITQKKI
jgi:hypothetical protein